MKFPATSNFRGLLAPSGVEADVAHVPVLAGAMHDFAVTKQYALFHVVPIVSDWERLKVETRRSGCDGCRSSWVNPPGSMSASRDVTTDMRFCSSPLFLATRAASSSRILVALRRLDPTLNVAHGTSFVAGDDSADRLTQVRLTALFAAGRGRSTGILWIACFLSMGSIAMLASWLPAFFQTMNGISIQRFAVVAFAGLPGSLAGILCSGWLLSRAAAHRVIPVTYLGLAGSLVALGYVPFGTPLFTMFVAAWGFFQSGGQAMLNVLTTQAYPANIRGTGMGWAGGMGRIGGIVAPLLGGYALGVGMTLRPTLSLAALLPLGVAIAVAAIRTSGNSDRVAKTAAVAMTNR